MRNGIIADTLRKAGLPYRIIFGLNLPQIADIAATLPKETSLALKLWDNNSTRESMLLAPMVYPMEEFDMDTAMMFARTSPTAECMDNLCHKLLSKSPDAFEIATMMSAPTETPMVRYGAMRILWKLMSSHSEPVERMAREEYDRNDPYTKTASKQIIDELDFLRECE